VDEILRGSRSVGETDVTELSPSDERRRGAGEHLLPAFRLAAMTGIRRGEAFGLLWHEVDLESGR
jgi:integrase